MLPINAVHIDNWNPNAYLNTKGDGGFLPHHLGQFYFFVCVRTEVSYTNETTAPIVGGGIPRTPSFSSYLLATLAIEFKGNLIVNVEPSFDLLLTVMMPP